MWREGTIGGEVGLVEVLFTVIVEEVATEADAIDLDGEAGTAVVVTASLGFETDSVSFDVEDAEAAVEEGVELGEGATDPVVGDLTVAGATLVGLLEDVLAGSGEVAGTATFKFEVGDALSLA
jgi:hypothetical protein